MNKMLAMPNGFGKMVYLPSSGRVISNCCQYEKGWGALEE